jgi:hypothetical protein
MTIYLYISHNPIKPIQTKTPMNKRLTLLVLLGLLLAAGTVRSQVVIISDDPSYTTAASGAILDIKSTTKGFLAPRVSLTSVTDVTTISSPSNGLLVFNTNPVIANGTGAGYYYWDGAVWVKLTGHGQPEVLSTFAASTSSTLSPSNNMVFASGNITLTLPDITTADDGLQISIKNVGTFTDLVTIQGSGGATIDDQPNSTLTRWKGKTFVAMGGNWIVKEKDRGPSNVLDVSTEASWTTIPEVVAFLNAHMSGPTVVRLGCGTFDISTTQTISLPYPVTFEGFSYGETTIETEAGLGSNPAFSCATDCYFKMLSFDGTAGGSDAIRLTGTGMYHEIKDCDFTGFTRDIALTGNSEIWIFDVDFSDATGAGVEVNTGGAAILKISESDFYNCGKGINLASGAGSTVSILNCTFYNNTGAQIGINYIPASFTGFTSMFITNNAWNNTGFFTSGFDFTLSSGRDAKAFLQNNAGDEDKNPHCKINVLNGSSTTTITTANTWYKAQWTNTSSYTCKWTINNNKMTYQPVNKRDVWVIISGNLSDATSNRTISFGLVKNGVTSTRYGESTVRITSSNQPFQFTTVVYLSDVNANDYFELYCTSNNSGDVLTFQDVNWFASAQ